MKQFLSVVAVSSVVLASTSGGAKVLAQQERTAVAAHKGTFNYLRDAPNRHSRIMEKMPQGTQMEVVGQSGDYYAVILVDGTRGWTYVTNVRFS